MVLDYGMTSLQNQLLPVRKNQRKVEIIAGQEDHDREKENHDVKNDQCHDHIPDHDPGHDQDRVSVIAEDVADDILLSVNTSNKILHLIFFLIACINSELGMLRRVGQIKEMFGAKYLIQSSRKSLSISALQSATGRYDKIDRDAKMIEIKNENNPTKKKALMRDLLRGYEVKKGPVQNVPNLEQTLLEIEMSKNNFYVKLNLYIYYLINYGSQRKLFSGRVAADFKDNPLGDVGIEIGRSHSEIIQFQKNRIFDTYGIEYNEELAIKSLGMPFIDFRWKELKELGIISKEKYESVNEKWESLSNEDLLNFQSNYFTENGLEIKATPTQESTTTVTSTTKTNSKLDVLNESSDGNSSLDEYKQRLLEFMKDPNQFKFDSMTELYQKGELKNTDCALYLAYKTGTVMRMPFQLNSILSSRSRWENLAKERGIKIDFDFFEVYSTTAAMYDNEIDGFNKKLGKKNSQ